MCHKWCLYLYVFSMQEEYLTCYTARDLIPQKCGPMTEADGTVRRLQSQQLLLLQPKQARFNWEELRQGLPSSNMSQGKIKHIT